MNTHEQYKKNRAQGYTAIQALRSAKHVRKRTFNWKWKGDEKATCEYEGFTLILKHEPDYNSGPDWLGSWTDKPLPGAIKRRNPGRNEFKFYQPEVSEEEHYRGLRAMKCGRALARELAHRYVMEDYKRMEEYAEGQRSVYAVRVVVYKNGIELGSNCIGGIDESDDYGERLAYAEELGDECAYEALCEARDALKGLCAGYCEGAR